MFCIFINFVSIYKIRPRRISEGDSLWWTECQEWLREWRNAVVPKLQFASYYLLVILLPLSMLLIFTWASFYTELW